MQAQNSGKESPAAGGSNDDVTPSDFDPSDREERRDETHERGEGVPLCDVSNPVQRNASHWGGDSRIHETTCTDPRRGVSVRTVSTSYSDGSRSVVVETTDTATQHMTAEVTHYSAPCAADPPKTETVGAGIEHFTQLPTGPEEVPPTEPAPPQCFDRRERDGAAEEVLELGKVGGRGASSIAQAAAISSADTLTDNLEQDAQAKREARKEGNVPALGSGAQSVEKDAASRLDKRLASEQRGTPLRVSWWSKEEVRKRQLREDAKATVPTGLVAGATNSEEPVHAHNQENDAPSSDRSVSFQTLEDDVLAKSRSRGNRPTPADAPGAMSVLARARQINAKMCSATAGLVASAANSQDPGQANSPEDDTLSKDRSASMQTLEEDILAKSRARGNRAPPADAPGAVSVLARAKRIDAKMCATTAGLVAGAANSQEPGHANSPEDDALSKDRSASMEALENDALAKRRARGNGPTPADAPGATRVLASAQWMDNKLCAAKAITQPHNPQDDAWSRAVQREEQEESDRMVLVPREGPDQTQGMKEEGMTPDEEEPTIERGGGASPREEEHRPDIFLKPPGDGDASLQDETFDVEPCERSNIGRDIVDRGTTSAPEPDYGICEAGGGDEDEGLVVAVEIDPEEENALMPVAIEYDVDTKPALYRNRRFRLYATGGAVLFVMLAVGVTIGLTKTVSDEDGVPPPKNVDKTSTPMPTTTTLAPTTSEEDKLMEILEKVEEVTPELIADPTSSESKAFHWMTKEDPLAMSILTAEDGSEAQGAAAAPDLVQRFLLANFFFATTNDASNWTYCGYSGDPTNENCTAPSSLGEREDMELEYPWLCQQHECEWYGVYCGEDNETRLLTSSKNHLNGTLPSNLYHLKEMQFIRLNKNNLTGTIPPEYGNMKHLINFEVLENELSGTIPEEIYKADALQRVNFGSNYFTGTMSTMIGNLPSLKGMFYFDNQLDGPFPTEIGKLEYLTYTRIGENAFTGSIPTEIGNLKKVREFWLNGCNFNGTIPTQIGGMADLETFRVQQQHGQGLSGPLPDSLYDLSHLRQLYVFTNHLTGTISTEVGRLTNMERLVLRMNEFNGTIPTELAELTKLKYLWLHYNEFDGPVPDVVCNLRVMNLGNLYADCLRSNETGPIPNPCECCTDCCDNVKMVCFSET